MERDDNDPTVRRRMRADQLTEAIKAINRCDPRILVDAIRLDETTFRMVLDPFLDPWSEIRKDSFKKLKKELEDSATISNVMKNSFRDIIFINLDRDVSPDGTNSSISWQHLHGYISLMRALLILVIDTESMVNRIFHVLLRHLVHSQESVRSSTSDCIIDLLGVVLPSIIPTTAAVTVQSYISIVISKIRLPHHDNVMAGALLCITSMIESNLLINESVSFLDILANKEKSLSNALETLIEVILQSCCRILSHSSSILRQKAGHVIVVLHSIYLSRLSSECLQSEEAPSLQRSYLMFIYADILAASFSHIASGHWMSIESCLLIAEEIIRATINNDFKLLSTHGQKTKFISGSKDSIYNKLLDNQRQIGLLQMIESLYSIIGSLLLHPQYELRRMAAQILPSISRAAFVYDIDYRSQSHIVTPQREDIPEFNEVSASSKHRDLVKMVLIKEHTKVVQHFIAAFSCNISIVSQLMSKIAFESSQFFAILEPSLESSTSAPNAVNHTWIMDLSERLQEEENKASFHQLIQQSFETCSNEDKIILINKTLKQLANLSVHAQEQTDRFISLPREYNQVPESLCCDFVAMEIFLGAAKSSLVKLLQTVHPEKSVTFVKAKEAYIYDFLSDVCTTWIRQVYLLQTVAFIASQKHQPNTNQRFQSMRDVFCTGSSDTGNQSIRIFPSMSSLTLSAFTGAEYCFNTLDSLVTEVASGDESNNIGSLQAQQVSGWLCELIPAIAVIIHSDNWHQLSLFDHYALVLVHAQWMLLCQHNATLFEKHPQCRKYLINCFSLCIKQINSRHEELLSNKQHHMLLSFSVDITSVLQELWCQCSAATNVDAQTCRTITIGLQACSATLLRSKADCKDNSEQQQQLINATLISLNATLKSMQLEIIQLMKTFENSAADLTEETADNDDNDDNDGDEFSDWDEESISDINITVESASGEQLHVCSANDKHESSHVAFIDLLNEIEQMLAAINI